MGSEAQPGDGQGQGGAETQSGQGETGGQEGQGGQGDAGEQSQPGGSGQSQGEPGGQEGQSGSTSAGAGESSSGQGRQERQELLAIAEALEEVARQLDAGQVDPRLLEQLDMTGPELRVFVKKYAPLAQQLSPAPAGQTQSPRRIETIDQTGDASTQAGRGGVTASRQGPAGSARDPNVRQQHDVRVAPKHRPRLEGYLRAVSQDKP